ncbi:MAG: hypothetical protein K0U98_26815 [Deltaproteobacteria bacterium]|nr:hypothetical protein [Deltaproteobacteria bacterium]
MRFGQGPPLTTQTAAETLVLVLFGSMTQPWHRGLLLTLVRGVVVDDARSRILVGTPHMIVARRCQQHCQREQ